MIRRETHVHPKRYRRTEGSNVKGPEREGPLGQHKAIGKNDFLLYVSCLIAVFIMLACFGEDNTKSPAV